MDNFENTMHQQVLSLPELLRQQYEDLEPKVRKVLTTPEIFSIQHIVLTGCGDSHAAAMAVKYTFEALTGLPTEVVPAIELSRYYREEKLGGAPADPLVIAVSNSGSVARVGEAIQRVVKHGAFALAVTGNRGSILGSSASRILDLAIPAFPSCPGTRSYLVSLLALHLLAIRIGEVRGRYTMDQAMAYRYDILAQADKLEEMLPEMDRQMLALASAWKDKEAFDLVGAGPDFSTAWFGQAKVYEATGRYAMSINTEEWLHLNFFMRRVEHIGTVVVCSSDSPALSRAKELIAHASEDMGRSTLVITDGELGIHTDAVICRTPKTAYPMSGILTQFVPLCLLTGYIAAMIGEVDGRGCEGPWAFAQNGAGVKNSEIIVK